ncbi:AAA family ATPase [Spirosoma panaciterrae]|uniref:AAA family ATPase n=1 Tax=Spirosoma panaciterrae TaxID=496058 RepID=UPI00035E7872|nr:ATP-binding protein [Spirosoma panaciterrae]
MLRSLEIRNYRNLRHLTIEKLGRVNLLVGKNNTGKTSVLEAVAIYASWFSEGATIKYLLQSRGEYYANNTKESPDGNKENDNITSLSALFTNYAPNYFLSGDTDLDIYIGENRINKERTKSSLFIGLRKAYQILQKDEFGKEIIEYMIAENEEDINAREFRYEIRFWRDYTIETRASLTGGLLYKTRIPRVDESAPFQYVDSKNKTQQSTEYLYSKIALSDKEDIVVKALQIVEPQIERFSLVEDRRPIVRLNNGDRRYMSSMGDGVSRVFSIILSMVNAEGTYLFIDEFENGLHYSVQEKLWEVIFYLAKRLNIQVFATTHSLDCVEAFSAILNDGKQDKNAGAMIRLENYEGNIEATVYDADEIQSTTRVHVDPR